MQEAERDQVARLFVEIVRRMLAAQRRGRVERRARILDAVVGAQQVGVLVVVLRQGQRLGAVTGLRAVEAAAEQLDRRVGLAQRVVQASEQALRGPRHRRIELLRVELGTCRVEQVAHADGRAQRVLRRGGLEGVGEEAERGACARRIALGRHARLLRDRLGGERAIAFAIQAPDEQAQRQRGEHARGDADAMPADELAQAVRVGHRCRAHRPAVAVAIEVVAEFAGAGVAPCGIFVGGLGDDAGQFRIERQRRRRARPAVGATADQFAQQHAEAVEVAGGGHRAAFALLRAGVAGAEDARGGFARGSVQVDQPRDAEIEQLDLAGRVDQHVGRLQVAMHDQALVRVADRIEHRVEQFQAIVQVRRVVRGVVEQVEAVDVFEREPRLAFGGLAAVEQARDVRVVQAGQDLPFLAQAAQAVGGRKAAQQLDRHALVEAAVDALGEEHRAHAAGTEFADQPVRTEAVAVRRRQARRAGAERARQRIVGVGVGFEQAAQGGAFVLAQRQRGEGGFALVRRQGAQAFEIVGVAVERRRAHAVRAVFSQARASRRSRSTVPSETSSAAATSGRVRPPK